MKYINLFMGIFGAVFNCYLYLRGTVTLSSAMVGLILSVFNFGCFFLLDAVDQ